MTNEEMIFCVLKEHAKSDKELLAIMAELKDKQFAEQKQQLIDNACKWIGHYLMDLGCPDDWRRDSQTTPSGEQLFRKAMKGEDDNE